MQYALLTTALTTPPHKILHHLRWSRVVNEGDEDDQGLAGCVSSGIIWQLHVNLHS
jgi:hypothetical protein